MAILVSLLFPALLAAAAVNDVRTFKIPNKITAALVVAWPLAALYFGMSLETMMWSVVTAGVMLIFGFVLYAFKIMGAGDSKLIAAAALWIGAGNILAFILGFATAGGAMAMAILTFRQVPLPVMLATQGWAATLHSRSSGMPYGVAIAIGGLLVWPRTAFFAF